MDVRITYLPTMCVIYKGKTIYLGEGGLGIVEWYTTYLGGDLG